MLCRLSEAVSFIEVNIVAKFIGNWAAVRGRPVKQNDEAELGICLGSVPKAGPLRDRGSIGIENWY